VYNDEAAATPICQSIIAIGSTVDFNDTAHVNSSFQTKSSDDFNNQFTTDEQFICQLQDGSDLPLQGSPDQIQQLRSLLNNGTLVSGHSYVDVQESQKQQQSNTVAMMRARPHSPFAPNAILPINTEPTALTLPPGPIHLKQSQSRRELATYQGPKSILAVKVIDKNGLQHPDSPSVISDKIFGTYGDTSTLTSQFAACSFNKLEIHPAGYDNDKLANKMDDVGVVVVEIPVSLQSSSQSTIRSEVKKAVEKKLEMGLPGKLDHIMIILENCYVECGW
jgi:hypothetical protein